MKYASLYSVVRNCFICFSLVLTLLCLHLSALAADGDIDTTFGDNGIRLFNNILLHNVAVQPDGKLLAVGGDYSLEEKDIAPYLARLSADGNMDMQFHFDGSITETLESYDKADYKYVFYHDEKILVAGGLYSGSQSTGFFLARYYSKGGVTDTSFGNESFLFENRSNTDCAGAAIMSDGRIVIASNTYQYNGITYTSGDVRLYRFNKNGTRDNTFGAEGLSVISYGGVEICEAFLLQPDGKALMAGTDYSTNDIILMRTAFNGTYDHSFGAQGRAVLNMDSGDHSVRDVIMLPDKKIVIAVQNEETSFLARFTASGQLDTTYGDNGIVTLTDNNGARVLAHQSDGTVVSGGVVTNDSQSDFLLRRYGPTGDQAMDFGDNGDVVLDYLDKDSASSLMLQDSANVVTTINSSVDYPEQYESRLIRFKNTPPPGDIVTPYDGWYYSPGEPGTGLSVAIQNDIAFLVWYLYDEQGRPVWYASWAPYVKRKDYSGELRQYSGMPPDQPWAPVEYTVVGTVTIEFQSEGQAYLVWELNSGDFGIKTIDKYMPSLVTGDKDSRYIDGWWIDEEYPGNGFYMETAGDTLYLGWYRYRDDMTPEWRVLGGWRDVGGFPESKKMYTASLQEYGNGQVLGGSYQPAELISEDEEAKLTFSGSGRYLTIKMQWNGKTFDLSRYLYDSVP